MRLTEFFIRRPAATTLLAAALAGFGVLSYFSLPTSSLPEVEYPTIRVSAVLAGANPDTMASTVATPLETEFSSIPGVEHMISTSLAGQTNITLQFNLDRSVDAAAQDVQAAIARAAGALPSAMQSPPSYSKVNPAQDPILWLEMSSKTISFDDFAKFAREVFAKRIAMVNGVSQVAVYGPDRPAIRIEADPAKLAAYGLDLEQLRTALTAGSTNMPSGTLYGDSRDYSLATDSQLSSAPEFSQLVVAYRNGAPLRLNQVASVINGSSNDKATFWIDGQRSVILAVRKQPGANTVEVADHVKEVILSLRDSMPPGVAFGKVADQADIVRDSIAEVNRTLLITVSLVVLVIFAFLGTLSSTLIASATIPISILGSFIAMRLLGYSVDIFSMLALTLSIGFIVDDAIVVIENVVRHREMGKGSVEAALDGAGEVGFTVISMTLSLVAVFLPVLFLGGVLGRLLREFAVAISVSILLSGITALTLTPMLASRFLTARRQATSGFARVAERCYAVLEETYQRSLEWVLQRRRMALVFNLVTAALTAYLFLVVPKSFLPAVDVGSFSGSLEAAQDTSFERMVAYGQEVNKLLAEIPWQASNLSGIEAQNAGWFHVNLAADRRRPNVALIMSRLQAKLSAIPGLKVYLRQDSFLNLGQDETRSQYAASLQGPDAEELYRWAPRLQARLALLPELVNVSSDLEASAPRLNIAIQRDLARSLDVDPEKIANTLYDAYGNRRASGITATSEQYDILLQVAKQYQQNPDALQSLYVLSNAGHLVPLSAVTTTTEAVAPLSAHHIGQFPAVTFQFDLKPGVSLERATGIIRAAAEAIGMPATLSFAFQGTAAKFQSSLKGLGLLLGIAILVIYLVLGMLYESFIHPLTILSGLPSAGIGALLTLLACGKDLNLYSFLGIILLIGIVKKNAIMIVDFALDAERSAGLAPEQAIRRGCVQRLRPILMTTMAALLGALPVAFGIGVGGEARRPLGIAIAGGLLLSQPLTLYITPVVYLYLHRFQQSAQARPDSSNAGTRTPGFSVSDASQGADRRRPSVRV